MSRLSQLDENARIRQIATALSTYSRGKEIGPAVILSANSGDVSREAPSIMAGKSPQRKILRAFVLPTNGK